MAGDKTIVRELAADMWSVGVIMFELFTGRRFFDPATVSEGEVFVLVGLAARPRCDPSPERARYSVDVQRAPTLDPRFRTRVPVRRSSCRG